MEIGNADLSVPLSETKTAVGSAGLWERLKQHPKDLWILYLLEFFIEIPFALIISGCTIYNIQVQKFTEIEAGIIFAFIGLAVGVCAVVFSNFPAKHGMKKGLFMGSILGLLTNILMYLFKDRYVQVVIMFTVFIPSVSVSFVSLKLAVKQYTFTDTRSLGYSLFYMIFFTAVGISAATIDILLTIYGVQMKPFSYIFLANCISCIISICITTLLKDFHVEAEEDLPLTTQSAWEYTKEAVNSPGFWKFFSLVLWLSIIKSMYFHLNATLPEFMYRVIGEGAHFGYVIAGHQLVLIIATVSLTFLTKYFTSFTLLICGSFITTFSVVGFLFGNGYLGTSIFAIVISFGEAIYAPRLIDYTLQVSPKGKEALYIGLANIPNFLSLLVTGISSGVLLSVYCPVSNTDNCENIWFWIGGYSLVTCIFMFALSPWYDTTKPLSKSKI